VTALPADSPASASTRDWLRPALVFGAIALAAHVAAVFWGRSLADEGMYLYSSRRILEGAVPYRDFVFWQPPPVLYAYAIAGAILGFRLIAMRAFTALLALGGVAMAADVVRRRGGAAALWLLVPILALNVNFAYDTTVVKTQGLTVFLSLLPLWVFERAEDPRVRYGLAAALMALAAGSRASFLPLMLVFPALVSDVSRSRRWALGAFAISAGIAGLGFAVWHRISHGEVVFGLLTYNHAIGNHVSILSRAYLAGLFGNQLVVWLALPALLVTRLSRARPRLAPDPMQSFLLSGWIFITALHFNLPFKYPTHQTSNLPLVAIYLSIALARIAAGMTPARARLLRGAVWAVAIGSIPLQEYPLYGGTQGTPASITAAAERIRPWMGPGATLYTSEAAIASEGGYRLVDGMNLGFYSLLGAFGMEDQTVRAHHLVDNAVLLERIESAPPEVVLLQPWDRKLMAQDDMSGVTGEELEEAIASRYRNAGTIDGVGQFFQATEIWVRDDLP
jgi:hypothetical protein